jgi:hypothetical protein
MGTLIVDVRFGGVNAGRAGSLSPGEDGDKGGCAQPWIDRVALCFYPYRLQLNKKLAVSRRIRKVHAFGLV